MDHTANHYFALAAIIQLGLYGLKNELRLPPPVNDDPSNFTEAEREKLGLKLLPQTFDERRQASESCKILREIFGEELITNIFKVNEADWNYFSDKTHEEEV